jgi:hypothetical protein
VSDAVDAILRAVDGRRDRVTSPRWLAPALPLRGILRVLVGREARRDAPGIEERWAAVARERGVGEASRPQGPARAGLEPTAHQTVSRDVR